MRVRERVEVDHVRAFGQRHLGRQHGLSFQRVVENDLPRELPSRLRVVGKAQHAPTALDRVHTMIVVMRRRLRPSSSGVTGEIGPLHYDRAERAAARCDDPVPHFLPRERAGVESLSGGRDLTRRSAVLPNGHDLALSSGTLDDMETPTTCCGTRTEYYSDPFHTIPTEFSSNRTLYARTRSFRLHSCEHQQP